MNKKQIFMFILVATLTGSVFAGPKEDLFKAVLADDSAAMEKALAQGADINAQNENDNNATALLYAVLAKSPEIVQFLLDNGADVNLKDGFNQTVFDYNPTPEIKAVLNSNRTKQEQATPQPSPTIKNPNKSLVDAAIKNDIPGMKKALAQGADINAQNENDNNATALLYAVLAKSPEIVQFLLDNGADVNLKDGFNQTVFDYNPTPEIKAVLKKYQSLPTPTPTELTNANNALFEAAEFNNIPGIQNALSMGANINTQNDIGRTPLMVACMVASKEAVQFLINKGADLTVGDRVEATAFKYCTHQYIKDIVQTALYEKLSTAVKNHKKDKIQSLLKSGADVNFKTKTIEPVIITALYQQHKEIIALILSYNPQANVANQNGTTPLMFAAIAGYDYIIDNLVKNGAQINAQDNKGRTALMIAADNDHLITVKALLDNGADKTLKDRNQKTAFNYAKNNEIKKLLL